MDRLISFIQPSRNNLKYLKWSYKSIRKNSDVEHEICVASDYSTDGTVEWCEEISKKDKNFKYIVNDGTWFGKNKGEPSRMGHTLLYDKIISDIATNDIVMIWHSDMYACPNMDTEVLKHLKPGTVVSATRIEPPLHPDGPEKILMDFGIEVDEFNEQGLLNWLNSDRDSQQNETTDGIFAPWAIMKKDFQSIGGHDPLYAPQSKEDSDIFNRMQLNGYKFIQTWKGFVYHMTCRGSRFKEGVKRNPDGEVFMKNRETDEWLKQNQRSTRNFIRKWGHFVKHDSLMKPIISPKYDVGLVVENCDINMLREIEPWCSNIYIPDKEVIKNYIESEHDNTLYSLNDRVILKHEYYTISPKNDIIVEFDCRLLTPQNFQILVNLSDILKESGEIGKMEYDIFKITINSLETYENDLIIADKSGELR